MSSLKSSRPTSEPGPAYDDDFVGWTEHQAALIRKHGASGALPGIDLDNLVGRSKAWDSPHSVP